MKQNPSITVASYKIPYNYKPSVYGLMHICWTELMPLLSNQKLAFKWKNKSKISMY